MFFFSDTVLPRDASRVFFSSFFSCYTTTGLETHVSNPFNMFFFFLLYHYKSTGPETRLGTCFSIIFFSIFHYQRPETRLGPLDSFFFSQPGPKTSALDSLFTTTRARDTRLEPFFKKFQFLLLYDPRRVYDVSRVCFFMLYQHDKGLETRVSSPLSIFFFLLYYHEPRSGRVSCVCVFFFLIFHKGSRHVSRAFFKNYTTSRRVATRLELFYLYLYFYFFFYNTRDALHASRVCF